MLSWVSSYFYGGTPIVTVFSKTESFCGMCSATKRHLTKEGIEFEEKSLEALPTSQIDAWRAQGHMAAPVVVTDAGVWSGYRPDLIATLV